MEVLRRTPFRRISDAFDSPVSSLPEIGRMYWPALIETFAIYAVSLLNLAVYSTLGTKVVVGISMNDAVAFTINFTYTALGLAASVLISQHLGAGQEDAARKAFVQFFAVTTALSLVLSSALLLLRRPLMMLLYPTADPDAMRVCIFYFTGVMLLSPFNAMSGITIGMLRSYKRVGSATLITGLSYASILLMNTFTILALKKNYQWLLGGMLISRAIFAVLVYALCFSKRFRVTDFNWKANLAPDSAIIREFFRVGIPFILENAVFYIGSLVITMIAVRIGTLAAAINSLTNSLMNLLQCAGLAASNIAVVIVGRAAGIRDIATEKQYIRTFRRCCILLNTAMFALILALFRPIAAILHAEAEAIPTLFTSFLIVGISTVLLWPYGFLVPNCLKAAGDVRFATVTAIIILWVTRIAFAYLLGITFGLGIICVPVATAIEWLTRAVVFMIRSKKEVSYQHELIQQ